MPFHNIFSKRKARKRKPKKQPIIIADIHEKNSLVISELIKQKGQVEIKHLKVGDYITNSTLIERKTASDFLSSMINKRLTTQLKNMQKAKNKLLIIEGNLNKTPTRIHENAIKGFLLSISLNYQTPIIFTKNSKETAKYLIILSKQQPKEESLNPNRIPRNKKEQLQFIVEGFPTIGPKTAKKLLKEFKTLKNIINTSLEDLEKLIGKKSEVFKILDFKY